MTVSILGDLQVDFDLDLTYYLAGPMSGYEEYNYPAFEKAAVELRESGVKILSPHEIPWPRGHEKMQPSALWGIMMEETAKLILECNGIILLKGWPSSRGAGIELRLFLDKDQPVFYYDNYRLIDMNRSAA